jgi:biotin synthase-like enzyme
VSDIAAVARERVLERGERLTQAQILEVLQIPEDRLGELLALAHEVRLKWCGHPQSGAGRRAGRPGRAPLQPQPGDGALVLPRGRDPHTWAERWDTCLLVRRSGMELCCGALVGMGETVAQRAELAAQLGALGPDEVPLNFLNPRPGTPFGDLPVMAAKDALRTIAAFRLALPRTILRYAGGRELTLGDLGTRDGLLGGVNAVIVGNYLTTLGRDPGEDLALLADLRMPIKSLNATL